MRIIGRNATGSLVGTVEGMRDGQGHSAGIALDDHLRITASEVLAGFRESIGFLFGLGAISFEMVGAPIDEDDPMQRLKWRDNGQGKLVPVIPQRGAVTTGPSEVKTDENKTVEVANEVRSGEDYPLPCTD